MLNKGDLSNGPDGSFEGAPEDEYAHLIGEPSPHLELATCIYFDGLQPSFSVISMLDLVVEWFAKFDFKPKVLLIRGSDEIKLPRYTINTFRKAESRVH